MNNIIVAAAVVDFDGRLLLGRRRGDGLYGVPGGKLEPGETLRRGCSRELLEETGLRAAPHDLVEVGYCEREDVQQIIFWFWVAKYLGHPRNMEPHKCDGWEFRPLPLDEDCIPGLRIFKWKLMYRLHQISNTGMVA